jgi:hypothetical protein
MSNMLTGFAKVTSFARDATSSMCTNQPVPAISRTNIVPTNGANLMCTALLADSPSGHLAHNNGPNNGGTTTPAGAAGAGAAGAGGWFFGEPNAPIYSVASTPPHPSRMSNASQNSLDEDFEVIDATPPHAPQEAEEVLIKQMIASAKRRVERHTRGEAVTPEEWIMSFDEDGRIPTDEWAKLKYRIYNGVFGNLLTCVHCAVVWSSH